MSFLATIMGNARLIDQTPYAELEDLYPFPMALDRFVDLDVEIIYERILTDVLERSATVPEKIQALLWDNCLQSEKPEGLITLLVQAMTKKQKLVLVYDSALEVVYKASAAEQQKIEEAVKKTGQWKEGSKTGAAISFDKRHIVDFVRLYSALEYAAIGSFWKSMNLSKAVQVKVDQLRASVAQMNSEPVVAQGKAIATGLKKGHDVMIDAKDVIETAKPDVTATNSALEMINQRRSLYLKLPASYLLGITTSGLGDTGKADAKAVDRGLRTYFYSIIKPLFKSLFAVSLTYVPDESDQLSAGLAALQTFELVSDDYITPDEKRTILARMLGLTDKSWKPPTEEKSAPPPVDPAKEDVK